MADSAPYVIEAKTDSWILSCGCTVRPYCKACSHGNCKDPIGHWLATLDGQMVHEYGIAAGSLYPPLVFSVIKANGGIGYPPPECALGMRTRGVALHIPPRFPDG